MTDPIDRELAQRMLEGGLEYDADLLEMMRLAPHAFYVRDLPLEVRERPASSKRQAAKREPTREELETLIEQNEQSDSEADRVFADVLRQALTERE